SDIDAGYSPRRDRMPIPRGFARVAAACEKRACPGSPTVPSPPTASRPPPAEGGRAPAVVLCHGFPELAYSWRLQVPALVAAGFRVLAPDMRGYGDSDRPADVAAYDIHHLTGDLVGLLDTLDIERAVFVGHDWGGLVTWMMPLLHLARTAGVVGVNTPYLPRPPMPPVGMMRAVLGDNHYIVHFQQPGVADAALARDVRRVFT